MMKEGQPITAVWQKWRFSAPQTHQWLIKVWFSASTFVVKIATFAKPRTVRAHSNAHSASNIYLSVLRNHYSEIFPLFRDASFVTASCFQMQVDATKIVKCFSVSGCKASRPCSELNVWHLVAFNHLGACCMSAISVVTLFNCKTQANCKLMRIIRQLNIFIVLRRSNTWQLRNGGFVQA